MLLRFGDFGKPGLRHSLSLVFKSPVDQENTHRQPFRRLPATSPRRDKLPTRTLLDMVGDRRLTNRSTHSTPWVCWSGSSAEFKDELLWSHLILSAELKKFPPWILRAYFLVSHASERLFVEAGRLVEVKRLKIGDRLPRTPSCFNLNLRILICTGLLATTSLRERLLTVQSLLLHFNHAMGIGPLQAPDPRIPELNQIRLNSLQVGCLSCDSTEIRRCVTIE